MERRFRGHLAVSVLAAAKAGQLGCTRAPEPVAVVSATPSPTVTPSPAIVKSRITAPGHVGFKTPGHLTGDLVAAFRDVKEVEFFIIEPQPAFGVQPDFELWKSVGRCVVQGEELQELLAAFRAMLAPRAMTECGFRPHHGLRVQHGGHTYTVPICFTCGGASIHREDSSVVYASFGVSPKYLPVFQRVAKRHGLPVPYIPH